MKKFSVYYLPTSLSVMTNIHIWAGSAAEAIEHIAKNGVGYPWLLLPFRIPFQLPRCDVRETYMDAGHLLFE
jgi:hypothetical protein